MRQSYRTAGFIALLVLFPTLSAWAELDEAFQAFIRDDYATVLKETQTLADQGDVQLMLGWMYTEGKGVTQDYREAARLYHLAANQGRAHAECGLGKLYAEGKGVTQDYVEARKRYQKAADRELACGQAGYGNLFLNGFGVPQDYAEAFKWIQKGAMQGDSLACAKLGIMYSEGRGVPQDYVQAHMWYNLAGAAGREDATKFRDDIAKKMTPAQIAEAQQWRGSGSQKKTRSR